MSYIKIQRAVLAEEIILILVHKGSFVEKYCRMSFTPLVSKSHTST